MLSRDTSLHWPSTVGLEVKPVGEPDAGNRHVRFDERGEETERYRTAQATAPLLDSTSKGTRHFQGYTSNPGRGVS